MANSTYIILGFVGALLATALLFVVIEIVPTESSSTTFAIGAGLMLLGSVSLMLSERTRLAGVGFTIGVLVSAAGALVIAALSAVEHTV